MTTFDDLEVGERLDSQGDLVVVLDDITGWIYKDQIRYLITHLTRILQEDADLELAIALEKNQSKDPVVLLTKDELDEIEQEAYDKGRRDAKLDYFHKIKQAWRDGEDVCRTKIESLEIQLATAEKKAEGLDIRLKNSLAREVRTGRALEKATEMCDVANQRAKAALARCEKYIKKPRSAKQSPYNSGWSDALSHMREFLDSQG